MFVTGFRLDIHAWKSWEMPNMRDVGQLCSGLPFMASWGCAGCSTDPSHQGLNWSRDG